MTLWVLVNVFEEIDALPDAVAAVERVVGDACPVEFVFSDGRCTDFPADHDSSADGTAEWAAQHGVVIAAGGLDECAKRTAGLRLIDFVASDGDWVLLLDADEELTALDFPDATVGVIGFVRDSDSVSYDRARLYRWQRGLVFGPRHYELRSADGVQVAGLEDAPHAAPAGTGIHHDTRRSPEREHAKALYYRRLQDNEAVA